MPSMNQVVEGMLNQPENIELTLGQLELSVGMESGEGNAMFSSEKDVVDMAQLLGEEEEEDEGEAQMHFEDHHQQQGISYYPSYFHQPDPHQQQHHMYTQPQVTYTPQHFPIVSSLQPESPQTQPATAAPPTRKRKTAPTSPKDSKDRPHPCPHCPKFFATPSNLRDHVRLHSRSRSHPCPQCEKLFFRKQDLSRHMATHMSKDERPWECVNGCGKRFGRGDAMRRHASANCSLGRREEKEE
ncbi:hypothetical protein HDV05_000588 [Chytridiales sp. JEL 0842]|nr:hypothetical protein HDV05_000588 [Chytridiales sp. JEL 0842]